MAIRIPTTDQSKIFLGSQEIGAVYVGANKVWPDAPLIDPNAFIMRISVTAGQTITIPFYATTGYNGTIDWKDGTTSTITTYNDVDSVHTYVAAGDYDIEFTGSFPRIYYYSTTATIRGVVKGVLQWGNVNMVSLDQAFDSCSNFYLLPENITTPSNLLNTGSQCFYGTKITSAIIPNTVTQIGVQTFLQCPLTSVVIPSSVTTIGLNAFQGCTALTSVVIPNSVTAILSQTFYLCTSLTSVILPSTITSIDNYAFGNCTNASLVLKIYATTPPSIGSLTFMNLAATARIEVPAASLNAYKTASNWSTYAAQIFAQ